ncbi:hypothetical protein [Bacillus sp. WMMC1349]|uniref:hypothetical protein n=1 Tax=Bacillus sp. WMMC1349 TaxID=2736254 RepID=UPI0020A669DF|nr:hypothetical protein [Bacillus sp. WMMC1349]
MRISCHSENVTGSFGGIMKKLFLSGGGDAEQTQKLDQRFTEEIDRNKPLLYIPVAIHASRFDDCYEWISSLFHPLGI